MPAVEAQFSTTCKARTVHSSVAIRESEPWYVLQIICQARQFCAAISHSVQVHGLGPALKEVFMAHYGHILVQSVDGVKTITLNRPEKRNALSPVLIDELIAALDEAAN